MAYADGVNFVLLRGKNRLPTGRRKGTKGLKRGWTPLKLARMREIGAVSLVTGRVAVHPAGALPDRDSVKDARVPALKHGTYCGNANAVSALPDGTRRYWRPSTI